MNIKFKPSPAQPHYTFSIRDLTHVFTGISHCSKDIIKTIDDLINLINHECNRALHDRLITESDGTVYFEVMRDALDLHFMVIILVLHLILNTILDLFKAFQDKNACITLCAMSNPGLSRLCSLV